MNIDNYKSVTKGLKLGRKKLCPKFNIINLQLNQKSNIKNNYKFNVANIFG